MHMNKFVGLLAGVALAATAGQATAQTDPKFALDWKFEGPSAPYFVAIDKGYYKGEGLNVTIDTGPGSVARIARVAAGTYADQMKITNYFPLHHDSLFQFSKTVTTSPVSQGLDARERT
jgi:NMT1/THI5 like